MDFTTAEQERERLRSQHAAGQITGEAYAAAVSALRVTDASGRWWQPDPSGPGWLVWNGSTWTPASPPSGAGGLQPGTAKDFNEFKSSLMTVDEFRKMSKDVPLTKRPQKWWDLLSILGGIVSAVIWLLYSGIREGFDLLTPVLMVAIPVILVWFRADIDVMLLPLQPHRRKFSKLLLTGIGIAFPFLTSFILYTIGIRQYPLMQWTMLIGTFGAYAITRTPEIRAPGAGTPPAAGTSPTPLPRAILVFLLAAIGSFLILPVRADDCASDILNAQDCLRTDGYAEAISGTFSTMLSGFVNGPTIVKTLTSGGTDVQPPQPPQQPPAEPQPPAQPGEAPDLPDVPEVADEARPETEGPYVVSPEEQERIDEALRQMRAEKERQLAEAAARAAAEQKARDNLLQKLQHMDEGMVDGAFANRFTADDYERVSRQIDKVSEQLRSGGKVDLDLYSKIYRVYEGRVTGRTIPAGEIPSEAQILRETIQGGIEGTSREIFTGMDADGNFSYKSLALRGLVGIATGGSSELAYTPASSLYTMKDYVDKGGDSVLGGFGHAMVDVVIGELMGRGIEGLTKVGGKLVNMAVESLPTSLTTPVKEGLERIKDVLNTEIKNPFAAAVPDNVPSGGLAGTKPALQSPAEIGEQIYRDAKAGQPHAGLDDVSFKPAEGKVNTAAYSPDEQKAIRFVAEQNGAEVHFRDVNEYSVQRIQSGEAYSKPASLKSNTVSPDDVKLGFSDEHKGLVSCKEPVLPERPSGMTDGEWGKLNNRYEQRLADFNDNAAHLADLEKQGKITWDRETGLIRNGPDGKPFAGDHDAVAFTDPVSKKPVSPFTANRMNQQLQDLGVTNHNHHTDWNYSNLSDVPKPGGGASDFAKAAQVDSRVLNSCTEAGGKPLETFNPLSGKWESNYYTGSTQRTFVQTTQVDGQTVFSKIVPKGGS